MEMFGGVICGESCLHEPLELARFTINDNFFIALEMKLVETGETVVCVRVRGCVKS